MKPENTTAKRPWLTDANRDHALKLLGCGLSINEIASILRISKSSVQYIKSAHQACIEQDWSTLQKMSTYTRATVDWAMRTTGTDKVFLETFPKEDGPEAPEQSVTGPTVDTPAPDPITREDFLSLYNTMQDICYLLTEIRDMLK